MYQRIRTRRLIEKSLPIQQPSVSEPVLAERPEPVEQIRIDLDFCEFVAPVAKIYRDESNVEQTLYLKQRCRKDKCGAWDNRNLRCMGRKHSKRKERS